MKRLRCTNAETVLQGARCLALPQREVRIVAIEHHLRGTSQGIGMFLGHFGHRLHELLMFALGVIDQHDAGLRQTRQSGGFATMVHTQFDHCGTMFWLQLQ